MVADEINSKGSEAILLFILCSYPQISSLKQASDISFLLLVDFARFTRKKGVPYFHVSRVKGLKKSRRPEVDCSVIHEVECLTMLLGTFWRKQLFPGCTGKCFFTKTGTTGLLSVALILFFKMMEPMHEKTCIHISCVIYQRQSSNARFRIQFIAHSFTGKYHSWRNVATKL
jgi:hypothetical protein